ncbi:hypothetical protein [Burkholderia cepacia]|uniref:hypothetical protein n=1 Tax=Burkholderia cepacia TaxID=292 RepID=UPI0012DA8BCA|nr:hypothetical protein [Burkholderia cepacia]
MADMTRVEFIVHGVGRSKYCGIAVFNAVCASRAVAFSAFAAMFGILRVTWSARAFSKSESSTLNLTVGPAIRHPNAKSPEAFALEALRISFREGERLPLT